MSREPGAGSREPGAGSREPGAGSAWGTFGCERTVLVVARTRTSTYRSLEAWELFRDDFRIQFIFTVNDTSAFSDGVEDILRQAGVRLVSWQAVRDRSVRYDLALSASENVDFEDIATHTIVLPHGLGFNKFVPDGSGGVRLAGLPPEWVLSAGRATVVLSHPEQREQLLVACPVSEGRTEIVGDPALARLQASQGLRGRYREALDTGNRTLVVLASTWRPDSLLGRWRSLPVQLLSELPSDLYQVCVVAHPNVWAFYGRAQISWWLSSALDAGLVLVPPESGWQAVLIAADQVIADHGSLGLFAAALDRPLLHAGSSTETVPGTPPDALLHATTELDPGRPLREQIDSARTAHRPGQFDHITGRVFFRTADAEANLRSLVYRMLDLAPPAKPLSLRRFPLPEHRPRPVTSHVVRTVPVEDDAFTVTRYPAAVRHGEHEVETHLVADETERDLKIVERAAVIVRDAPLSRLDAEQWLEATLDTYPGARIAATTTTDGCLAAVRDGTVIRVGFPTGRRRLAPLVGSAIYCCWLSQTLRDRRLTIHAGSMSVSIRLTVKRPPDDAATR
jgi:hypothetical protein